MGSTQTRTADNPYRRITRTIIQAIERGAPTFTMPWHGRELSRPFNAVTGRAYRGANVVSLWATSMLALCPSARWATYRQWASLGAQVRRGEQGATVIFFKQVDEDAAEPERPNHQRVIFARSSRVFSEGQVDGWSHPDPRAEPVAEVLSVESFVSRTGAAIAHGGDVACYRPGLDQIAMPPKALFVGSPTSSPTESYYATLVHELVHWTGAKHRLDRTFGRFGDPRTLPKSLLPKWGRRFCVPTLGLPTSREPTTQPISPNGLPFCVAMIGLSLKRPVWLRKHVPS